MYVFALMLEFYIKLESSNIYCKISYEANKIGSNSFFAFIVPYSCNDFFSFFESIVFALKRILETTSFGSSASWSRLFSKCF